MPFYALDSRRWFRTGTFGDQSIVFYTAVALKIKNGGLAEITGIQITGMDDHLIILSTGLSHDLAVWINN